ncbi:MAG: helicase RepA family protein [Clostridiales bacterium]|nr:helicase RepA family protein [Clostridiales bacterium]
MKEMEELRATPPRFDPNVDLHTVTMTELYDTVFPPRTPLIDGLLYSGTYLFAGSPKIGKSFFMMQLAYHVAMGIPLWDYPVRQGTVLYLALEDDYPRLQGRLMQMFGVESTDNLVLTTQSKTLAEGLTEQMERFMQRHPDTSLVIVDTLQKVREIGNESYSYAMDYKNIAALKEFTDRHNLCLLVVHHTRKMEASDSFETISGTTGLLGAADGAIVLQKKKRIEDTATMQIVGRDQEDQELELVFDRKHCFWLMTKAEKTSITGRPPLCSLTLPVL